jgi:hypothetical protein
MPELCLKRADLLTFSDVLRVERALFVLDPLHLRMKHPDSPLIPGELLFKRGDLLHVALLTLQVLDLKLLEF